MAAATLGYVILTRWGYQWLRQVYRDYWPNESDIEQFSGRLIAIFDEMKDEAEVFLDEHVYKYTHTTTNTVTGETTTDEIVKKKLRIRKGQRSCFAGAIAKRAYLKFGERKFTEANVMVTRKWLQKLITEDPKYSTLRTCDQVVAIDRALFLSFIPTTDFIKMQKILSSDKLKDRLGEEEYGKVFRLGASPSD